MAGGSYNALHMSGIHRNTPKGYISVTLGRQFAFPPAQLECQ